MTTICCSFCMKTDGEVARLVAGLGVYICNECVGLADELIRTVPLSDSPRLEPWEHAGSLEEALTTLPRVAATTSQVEASLAGWVRHARSLGATWATIGEALGMTRQSAWERFSGEQ